MVQRSMVAAAAVSLFLIAGPATAQQQEGLVNVNISDNNTIVQVPVAVAAELCDVSVNVITERRNAGQTACNITQDQANEANLSGPGFGQGQGQGAQQEGLVNVNVENNDTAVQVPVAVAAELCNVDVNVVAQQRESALTNCTITQEQANQANLPGFGQGQGQSQEQGLSTQGQTNQNQQNQENQTEQQQQ